ncbi:hypothetical protein HPB50_012399 [Hyalomma asiaticum]|uniref:Uncharacterized protein n=1 Tax=Hyalomma asiaticum TaxID=266040 RepID=A0ACB7T9K9_HYAAI|nr:hypothetical protein HPB50_012399 [Hyalomma asiaticum]
MPAISCHARRAIQMNRGHRPFYAAARHWTRPYPPASECPPPNRHQRRIPAGGPRTIVTWTLWTRLAPPLAGHLGFPGSYNPDQPLGIHEPRLRSRSEETFLRSGNRRCPWPLTYTPEEARFLCPTCGVPEMHWRQYQNEALHQTRLAPLRATAGHAPRAPPPLLP